jgi:hypothetical protein
MNHLKTAVIGAFAVMSLGLATASFAEGDPTPCECEEPGPGPKERADNGWGNGPDSTNPGSDAGGTAPSKSSNGTDRSDAHYPAALDRFVGR